MKTSNLKSLAIAALIERALPSKSDKVTFNNTTQMYETERYVSAAGNSYFRGIKLSDRIVLEFCCGDGWMYRFINSIRIYCFNGDEKQLIANRDYYCQFFNADFCYRECVEMLNDYLNAQAKLVGGIVEDSAILEFSKQLIESTNQKLIA